MRNKIQLLNLILVSLALTGCPPYSETKLVAKPTAASSVESLLLKTSTGADIQKSLAW